MHDQYQLLSIIQYLQQQQLMMMMILLLLLLHPRAELHLHA
jgi:hypothetical protein